MVRPVLGTPASTIPRRASNYVANQLLNSRHYSLSILESSLRRVDEAFSLVVGCDGRLDEPHQLSEAQRWRSEEADELARLEDHVLPFVLTERWQYWEKEQADSEPQSPFLLTRTEKIDVPTLDHDSTIVPD